MAIKGPFDEAKKAQPAPQSAMSDMYFWLVFMQQSPDALQGPPIDVPDVNSLKVGSGWPRHEGMDGPERSPSSRQYGPIDDDYVATPVSGATWEKFLDHLADREGYRNTVYRDSLGKPTVGVGHLVRPEDGLSVGDRISDDQVRGLLEKDASRSYHAAIEQANELGINDSRFVIALGSVNYQLGENWREKFPQTWQAMKDGNYDVAIRNIENSRWAQQTPVRTADFTNAISHVASTSAQFNDAVVAAAQPEPVTPDPDQAAPVSRPDAVAPRNDGIQPSMGSPVA